MGRSAESRIGHPGGRGGPCVRRALVVLRAECPATYLRLPSWIKAGNVYAWTLQQHVATPPWADRKAIARVYRERDRRKRRGEDVVVDHVVPLRSPLVCGLHVAENLCVRPYDENARKSNHRWPDSPHENQELFQLTPDPHQWELF